MVNFHPLILEEATGTGSFIDIFTSNIAIIVYIIIFALAVIAIAILFIVNESLTNEKISKIEHSGKYTGYSDKEYELVRAKLIGYLYQERQISS